MAGIECLTHSLVFVQVDERNLGCELEVSNLVEYSRSHIAGADDNDFSFVYEHNKIPLINFIDDKLKNIDTIFIVRLK